MLGCESERGVPPGSRPLARHCARDKFTGQLPSMSWRVAWMRPTFAFEQRFGLVLDVALPLANLHGMDIVLLRDLIDGLHAAKRL
jgi:hypothetical protein